MKFLIFFYFLGVIFALLDPDPDSEYGSGSTDLIESGTNTDPDPDTLVKNNKNPRLHEHFGVWQCTIIINLMQRGSRGSLFCNSMNILVLTKSYKKCRHKVWRSFCKFKNKKRWLSEHFGVWQCTIIINLMQRGRRALRDEGLDLLTVGTGSLCSLLNHNPRTN